MYGTYALHTLHDICRLQTRKMSPTNHMIFNGKTSDPFTMARVRLKGILQPGVKHFGLTPTTTAVVCNVCDINVFVLEHTQCMLSCKCGDGELCIFGGVFCLPFQIFFFFY